MPIYEFRCKKCGTDFEYLCFRNDDQAECPSCGESKTERLLSTFSCGAAGKSDGFGSAAASAGCSPSGGFS